MAMRNIFSKNLWHLTAVAAVCLSLAVSGCGPRQAATDPSQQTASVYATMTDDAGRTVTLTQKPQRVVVLSTSLLNFAAAVDGPLVGRATVKSEDMSIPESYQAVPDVGPVYNVSVEKILELQPDLVIASAIQHQKLIPQLEQNHIPVIALRSKTYEEVKRNMEFFGKIYGKEDLAQQKIGQMDQDIAAITSKLPKVHTKAVILHATPSSVTAQLPNSIAGNIAAILKLDNIASNAQPADPNVEKVPYSMEAIVEQDPDVIFFTSMGPSEKVEERIRQDVQGNPAWAGLRAVRQGRVYVLPEHYFLLNPGLDFPKAVSYMAVLVYPEVFR